MQHVVLAHTMLKQTWLGLLKLYDGLDNPGCTRSRRRTGSNLRVSSRDECKDQSAADGSIVSNIYCTRDSVKSIQTDRGSTVPECAYGSVLFLKKAESLFVVALIAIRIESRRRFACSER